MLWSTTEKIPSYTIITHYVYTNIYLVPLYHYPLGFRNYCVLISQCLYNITVYTRIYTYNSWENTCRKLKTSHRVTRIPLNSISPNNHPHVSICKLQLLQRLMQGWQGTTWRIHCPLVPELPPCHVQQQSQNVYSDTLKFKAMDCNAWRCRWQ